MKLKVLFYSCFIILIMVFQTTLLNYAAIYGVTPNVLIVLIIVAGLIGGAGEGGAVGFFTGLAYDLMFGNLIGFYTLLGFLLGVAAGSVNKRMFRENILVVLFFTFLFSLAYETIVYILNNIMSGNLNLVYPFTRIILPEAVYNCIVAIPVYSLILAMDKRFYRTGRTTRKY